MGLFIPVFYFCLLRSDLLLRAKY